MPDNCKDTLVKTETIKFQALVHSGSSDWMLKCCIHSVAGNKSVGTVQAEIAIKKKNPSKFLKVPLHCCPSLSSWWSRTCCWRWVNASQQAFTSGPAQQVPRGHITGRYAHMNTPTCTFQDYYSYLHHGALQITWPQRFWQFHNKVLQHRWTVKTNWDERNMSHGFIKWHVTRTRFDYCHLFSALNRRCSCLCTSK